MRKRIGEHLLLGTALLLVLLCTGLILTPHLRRSTFSRTLLEDMPGRGGVHHFVFVVQPRDCEGNLGFLDLLRRPQLTGSFELTGLLAGTEDDLPQAFARIADHAPAVTLRVISRRQAITLNTLGHGGTPYWLVLDPNGGVVLSGQAPATPEDYLRMARMLELISTPPSVRMR